jgi:hypothetical protein
MTAVDERAPLRPIDVARAGGLTVAPVGLPGDERDQAEELSRPPCLALGLQPAGDAHRRWRWVPAAATSVCRIDGAAWRRPEIHPVDGTQVGSHP